MSGDELRPAISPGVQQRISSPSGLFIHGAPAAGNGDVLTDRNPSTGEILAEFPAASVADVDRAVVTARNAFEKKSWRGMTPAARGRVLWRVGDLIEQDAEELGELEMLDTGKTLAAARDGEAMFAAECFRYHAGWCTKLEGQTKQISTVPGQDFHVYTLREPIGVAALIVPSNGPLVQAAWKLAPALAAGCSVVIKPDEKTPLTTLRLAELMIEAGVPAGVANVVTGAGGTVGDALVRHPGVSRVSFTGSTATGRAIAHAAADDMKKVTLELGGKSPMIVLADADPDQAAAGAAEAIFSNAGQICVAASRLYVEEPIYDVVVNRIAQHAAQLRVGPGHDPGSQMGPLISAEHLDYVASMVARGIDEGATAAAGGDRIDRAGYFYSPTVLTDVTNAMAVAQREIFGPVLSVIRIADPADIPRQANASRYGLAGSVWSRDISRAHRIAAELEAGLVWINCHAIPDMAVPFGGYKESGLGRENGLDGLLEYTQLKSVIAML